MQKNSLEPVKESAQFVIVAVVIGFIALIFLDVTGIMPISVKNLWDPYPTRTPIPLTRHAVAEVNQKLEPIWMIDKIFVLWDRFGSAIGAAAGKTCYLGSYEQEDRNDRLICIDSLTGKIAWIDESGVHSNLWVTPGGIFIIYSSPAGLKKYDPQNGNLIWRKSLSGSGSLYLYVSDDQVQVLTVPDVFWVLDQDGSVVRKESNRRIFFSTSEETFTNLKGIEAYQTGTNHLLWEYVDFNLERMPFFTKDKIFLRNGHWQGNAYALDRKTGELLWRTTNIVSGIAYSPDKQLVYALRANGDLLAIDENTGKESIIVKFSSVPFIVGGMASFSYQLAYDNENHILLVSLGDSRQLFAFQEK